MRKWALIVLGMLLLLALTTSVAWAQDGDQPGEIPSSQPGDVLWVTLAPLLAIATGIERVLEVFWDRWERVGAWPNRRGVADPSQPKYISQKRLFSHLIGTGLAIVAVGLVNARFFRLLGLDVLFSGLELFHVGIGGILDHFTLGTLVDWLLTAGVIGWGGTEITHSVIEGLVKGRSLWKEMREVQAGRMSVLDARFFNDIVVPELGKRGIDVARIRQVFQTLNSIGVPVDSILADLTAGRIDTAIAGLESREETAPAGAALRALLEGVPPQQALEIPGVLGLLTRAQRVRFLGA